MELRKQTKQEFNKNPMGQVMQMLQTNCADDLAACGLNSTVNVIKEKIEMEEIDEDAKPDAGCKDLVKDTCADCAPETEGEKPEFSCIQTCISDNEDTFADCPAIVKRGELYGIMAETKTCLEDSVDTLSSTCSDAIETMAESIEADDTGAVVEEETLRRVLVATSEDVTTVYDATLEDEVDYDNGAMMMKTSLLVCAAMLVNFLN